MKSILETFRKEKFIHELKIMILMGGLSAVLGYIKFEIPGVEAISTDLREIPLLIGILYIRNPVLIAGMPAISFLFFADRSLYLPNLGAHFIALQIISFTCQKWIKSNSSIFITAVNWILICLVYYLVFLIPLVIKFYQFSGFHDASDFYGWYSKLVSAGKFELLTTSAITMLYIMQRRLYNELLENKNNLEKAVRQRTEELQIKNRELLFSNKALEDANEELRSINVVLEDQKGKLNEALASLKEAQAQIIQSEKMVSLGVLTAGVSHEINNPLNYIQSGIYALENVLEEERVEPVLFNETRDIIGKMKIGVDKASAIVKSLNMLSRKDNKRSGECDIHRIIENSLLILNYEIKDKAVVECSFTEEKIYIGGNEEKLLHVFNNLIQNSVQALRPVGKIKISTSLCRPGFLEIIIEDNGAGISSENIGRVFDPFFTTRSPGMGTGLGLSIAYSIIKDHNGSIELSSDGYTGTKAAIYLPIKNRI